MRHLLTAIILSIIAIVLFMDVDWSSIDFSLSPPTFAESLMKNLKIKFNMEN